MSNTELPVTMTKLSDLKLHPDNSNEGDVGAISQSIKLNDWQGTIVVNGREGVETHMTVIAGNHRVMAAQALGMESVPVWWADMSDDEALAYMHADNRASSLAFQNDAQLLENLTRLREIDLLSNALFDDDDLQALSDLLNTDPSGERKTLDEAISDVARASWPFLKVQLDPNEMERFNQVEGETDREKLICLLGRYES